MVKILINRSVGDKASMSEEQAAEKIQASFRGYKTRKTLRKGGTLPSFNQSDEEIDEKTEDMPEEQDEKSAAEISVDSDGIEDIDLNDDELIRAATVIQNSYRNYLTRKQLQNAVVGEDDENEDNGDKGDEVDINLNDAELGWAAAVIQLSYKNYLSKKQQESDETETVQDDKGDEEPADEEEGTNEEENPMGIDLDDPELQNAAVKIQSAFRGYRVRKAMNAGETDVVDDEKEENEEE